MASGLSPESFTDPSARRLAEAVMRDDLGAALDAARSAPGGIDSPGRDGETALLLAVARRSAATAEALLRHGANPNGGPNKAPLPIAVMNRDLDLARRLLDAGADPDGRFGKETALYEAALVGSIPAAELLLNYRASPDLATPRGETPLLCAAGADHWRMAVWLLRHGASPRLVDRHNFSLADFAARSRILPDSDEGPALAEVIGILRATGLWPAP